MNYDWVIVPLNTVYCFCGVWFYGLLLHGLFSKHYHIFQVTLWYIPTRAVAGTVLMMDESYFWPKIFGMVLGPLEWIAYYLHRRMTKTGKGDSEKQINL